MRFYFYLIPFLFPLNAYADCPVNAEVIPHLRAIHKKLDTLSDKPILINEKLYIVRYGEKGGAAEDLLAGDFEGYILDRYQEKTPGTCRFQVRDNRIGGVRGEFVLQAVPADTPQ